MKSPRQFRASRSAQGWPTLATLACAVAAWISTQWGQPRYALVFGALTLGFMLNVLYLVSRRLVIDADGLTLVEWWLRRRRARFVMIDHANWEAVAARRYLWLYDAGGGVLLRLSRDWESWDEVVHLIRRGVKKSGTNRDKQPLRP